MELRLVVKLDNGLTGLSPSAVQVAAVRALAAAGLAPSEAQVITEEQYQADTGLLAALATGWVKDDKEEG